MAHLPVWARKPKHKKKVIATQDGWVVEETGEVLVSNKGLATKLDELYGEVKGFEDTYKDNFKETYGHVNDDMAKLFEEENNDETPLNNTKIDDHYKNSESEESKPKPKRKYKRRKSTSTTKKRGPGRPKKNASKAD